MNVPIHIARKYFFSVKKKAFINFISILAIAIVTFATAAVVIIMSAMNGFTDYIRKFEGALEGDIKISAVEGKTFELNQDQQQKIQALDGIAYYTEVLEDHAFATSYNPYKNEKKQRIVKVKGVTPAYYEQFAYDDFGGHDKLTLDEEPAAFVGFYVAKDLRLHDKDNRLLSKTIDLMYPDRMGGSNAKRLNQTYVQVVGQFIQQGYDLDYIILPLESAKALFNYENERTSIEISVTSEEQLEQVQTSIKAILGDSYKVENRDEQNAVLLKAIKLEKLIVLIILIVVLAIASINIFFTLSMLEVEKRKDIAILYAQGMPRNKIRKVFLYVGGFISFIGGLLGFTLGSIGCYYQKEYGLLRISGGEPYPIKVELFDNLVIAAAVIGITILASIRPAVKASKITFRHSL